MIIERDKLYRVEGYEPEDGNSATVRIEHISLLVSAPNIPKACEYITNSYFGMGTTFIPTKCELVQCG